MSSNQFPPPSFDGQRPAPGYPLPQPPATFNTNAIIAFVGAFVISLLGIVFGHIALAQIKQTGERGRGFAIAGLVIGYASVAAIASLISLIVIGGIAAGPTSSPTPTSSLRADALGSSPLQATDADCAVVYSAASALTSSLTELSPSMLGDETRAAISDAAQKFKADTSGVKSMRLGPDLEGVRAHLDALSDDLADYLAAGDGDMALVSADLTALETDFEKLGAACD